MLAAIVGMLRQSSRDECISSSAGTNQEHHILSTLELAGNPAEIGFAVDRLAVDFQDDVPGLHIDDLTKAPEG